MANSSPLDLFTIPHFYIEDYKSDSLILHFAQQFYRFNDFLYYDKDFRIFSRHAANKFKNEKKKIIYYELFNFLRENNEMVHNFFLRFYLEEGSVARKKIVKMVSDIVEGTSKRFEHTLKDDKFKNMGLFINFKFNCDLSKINQFEHLEEILQFLQNYDLRNLISPELIRHLFFKIKIQIIVQIYEEFKMKFEFNENRKILYCESEEKEDINREQLANIYYYIISVVRNILQVDYLVIKMPLDDLCPVTEEIKLMKDLNPRPGGKNTKIVFIPNEPTSTNILRFIGCGSSLYCTNDRSNKISSLNNEKLLSSLILKETSPETFFKCTKFCEMFKIPELSLTFTYHNNLIEYNHYFKSCHNISKTFLDYFQNFYFLSGSGAGIKQTYLTINIITLVNVDYFLDELLKKILESYNFSYMLNVNIFNNIGNDPYLIYDNDYLRSLACTSINLKSAKDYHSLYIWDNEGHKLLAKKVKKTHNSLMFFVYVINKKNSNSGENSFNYAQKLKKFPIISLITKFLCGFRLKIRIFKGENAYITY